MPAEARADYCSFGTTNQPTKLTTAQTHASSSFAIGCNPSQLSVPWKPVSHTGIRRLFVAGGPRASRHDAVSLSISERNSGSWAMPLLPQNAIHHLHLTIAGHFHIERNAPKREGEKVRKRDGEMEGRRRREREKASKERERERERLGETDVHIPLLHYYTTGAPALQ